VHSVLKKFSLLLFSVSFIIKFAAAQQTLYDLNSIQKIEIFFSQPNWDYQMDTAKYGTEDYIAADSVIINATHFVNVGVKYKGNSSYDSTYIKNPLHIELDTYANQSYQGFTDIKLGNGYGDPSMIREVLSYDILKNYMHCPRSNFAQVYINGNYIGLYSNDESINKEFCSSHFYSSGNTFIKCNPIINPGPTTKSSLRYLSNDSSAYNLFYEIKSDYGWNELVALCDSVTNHASNIASIMDIDRVIWMFAFNNVLVNLDSYSGVFCQNHYLYKDSYGYFNPIVWDLNMCFGGFPFAGSGATSFNLLTVTGEQQMSPLLHSGDMYWPLINAVLSNPMYKRMYIAHMRTITSEMFAGNLYQTTASSLQTLVDTAVQSDVNKFFTYTQFQNGMTSNTVVGSYTVPGISNLMSARVTYLQGTADFSYTPPMISSVAPSNGSPSLFSTVTITATVTNTNSNAVYLGYRSQISQKFTHVPMYDDGAHNDGTAGDNVYGTDITVSSAQMQYFIYAENNDAGMFSPQRAEHEYYTLNTNVQTASPGQVVINEFLADNITGNINETGVQADWIELYNNTNTALDLFGLYLTDNFLDQQKFAFPQNTLIPANGYRIIWADENNTTASYVHSNFKLAAAGEGLMLSNAAGTVLDSISFGTQSPDTSLARCQNGVGPFMPLVPTFAALNCPVGIEEYASSGSLVYPNPASDLLHVKIFHPEKNNSVKIFSATGQQVFSQNISSDSTIDLSSLPEGFYLVKIHEIEFYKVLIIR
jgi:hypothetical protein